MRAKEGDPSHHTCYEGSEPGNAECCLPLPHQAKNWGIEFGEPKIDVGRLRSWKESVVKRLTGGLGQLSKQRQVRYVQGKAGFENSNTLRVSKADGTEELLRFDRMTSDTRP